MEHDSQVPRSSNPAEPAAAASPSPIVSGSKPTEAVPTAPGATEPTATEPVAMPVPAPVPVARKGRGARLLNVALAGALVLAIAGVAFAAGRFTAPAAVTAGNFPGGGPGGQFFQGNDGQGGQNGQAGDPRGILGGGPTIEGTVESVTDTTLTIKTASGQTIQIALDDTTTYHAQTDASASDVTAGGKVLVRLDLGGASGNGNVTNPSASDVTVVP